LFAQSKAHNFLVYSKLIIETNEEGFARFRKTSQGQVTLPEGENVLAVHCDPNKSARIILKFNSRGSRLLAAEFEIGSSEPASRSFEGKDRTDFLAAYARFSSQLLLTQVRGNLGHMRHQQEHRSIHRGVESKSRPEYKKRMRNGALFLATLTLSLISCTAEPDRTVTHRARNGLPDEWVYRVDDDNYKIAIDTNGDGRPDVVKAFKDNQMIEIDSDRNFDGQTDLVQVYLNGSLIREIHDDDFDGKTEKIEEFRRGKLAIVERDPQERGYVDIVEYYDDSGKLIRREVRRK
jgi:hypothetical protein